MVTVVLIEATPRRAARCRCCRRAHLRAAAPRAARRPRASAAGAGRGDRPSTLDAAHPSAAASARHRHRVCVNGVDVTAASCRAPTTRSASADAAVRPLPPAGLRAGVCRPCSSCSRWSWAIRRAPHDGLRVERRDVRARAEITWPIAAPASDRRRPYVRRWRRASACGCCSTRATPRPASCRAPTASVRRRERRDRRRPTEADVVTFADRRVAAGTLPRAPAGRRRARACSVDRRAAGYAQPRWRVIAIDRRADDRRAEHERAGRCGGRRPVARAARAGAAPKARRRRRRANAARRCDTLARRFGLSPFERDLLLLRGRGRAATRRWRARAALAQRRRAAHATLRARAGAAARRRTGARSARPARCGAGG